MERIAMKKRPQLDLNTPLGGGRRFRSAVRALMCAVRLRQAKSLAQSTKPLQAFTLSELLMSVLVVSILLIAMAPVITKRQKDSLYIQFDKKNWEYSYLTFQNVLNADGISQCKDEEYETPDPDDSSIKYSFVVKHCKFNIPSYVKDLNAVLVSSGGGGAGSSLVNKTGYKVTKIGENLPQSLNKTTNARQTLSSNEIEITNNMTDVTVSYITGSGGGGGGAAWNYSLATSNSTPPAPQSQADCDSAAGAGISYYYNNLCITKKNIGYLMSVDELVASGIEVVTMVITSRWAGNT